MATPRPPAPTHDPKPRAPARKTGEHDDDDGRTWLEALEEDAAEDGPGADAPITTPAEDDDPKPTGTHERIRTDVEPT